MKPAAAWAAIMFVNLALWVVIIDVARIVWRAL